MVKVDIKEEPNKMNVYLYLFGILISTYYQWRYKIFHINRFQSRTRTTQYGTLNRYFYTNVILF